MSGAPAINETVLDESIEYTFLGLIALFILPCLIMNLIVIFSILRRNHYNVLNIVPKTIALYFHIALCDLMIGILTMPWAIYYIQIGRPAPSTEPTLNAAHNYYMHISAHRVFCVSSGYFQAVLVRVTSLMILLLSIDRTHAIYFPLTYSRPGYAVIYKYCTYGIWIFALGTQALPFVTGIPYIEQPTREFMCSWSIAELLGIEQTQINNNLIQIFFPYFILVDIPVVIPTIAAVCLSFAVLLKVFYKRYLYISEKVNQPVYDSSSNGGTTEEHSSARTSHARKILMAVIKCDWSQDNHKINSLTKASVTMLWIVLIYTFCFSYYWFICIMNTLYLLGIQIKWVSDRHVETFIYMNNSYQIMSFFNATITPFVVYYRVIKNIREGTKYTGGRTTHMNNAFKEEPAQNTKTIRRISNYFTSRLTTLRKKHESTAGKHAVNVGELKNNGQVTNDVIVRDQDNNAFRRQQFV